MKPILVLKQAEVTPAAASFASGTQNPLGNFNPLALVPFPKQVDPITGLQLRAQGPVQYQAPTFQPAENPYGSFSPEGEFVPANMFSSNLERDSEARANLRRLGHNPNRINEILEGPERTAYAQRRADKFNEKQERERAKFDTAQQKRQAGMSLQERLARGVAGRTGDTQEAFDTAMQRVGRGATAGKIGAGALAGLTGLMALQRANESGTDLISALGGAGAQGYSTYRYANPALQGLGMRGAARFTPNISQPTSPSPPVGNSSSDLHSAGETPFTYQEGESQFTPADSQVSFTAPKIAKPTVAGTVQTRLPGAPSTPLSEETYASMTGTELGEMNSDRDSMTHQSSIDEENQEEIQSTLDEYGKMNTVRDDFDEIYDSYNRINKGNRRSFVGVR
jgi:hypothetical protein